ncbi:STAS domain-containing protein [Amycolatopsis sp. cmx-4-68]|uniref:STAS domain-containing protein n=1 Tax=Amycolatopsis sp. cmx-4-68 TaxID=2790938 RepID=UPI003977FD14
MTEFRTPPVLETTVDAGITTVSCAGELELATSPRLRDALLTPLGDGTNGIVADLAAVTFCDSTIFSVLVETYREAQARNVPYAIAAGPAVARPLAILGLDRLLPLHPGVAEARAAVTEPPSAPRLVS